MENRIYIPVFSLVALSLTFLYPDPALATCDSVGLEGVYTHQFAHIFFIISMVGILWNIDAFAVHLLDERFNIIQVETIGPWQIKINDYFDNNFLKFFYYLVRVDYLLCLPAFILFLSRNELLSNSIKSFTVAVNSFMLIFIVVVTFFSPEYGSSISI